MNPVGKNSADKTGLLKKVGIFSTLKDDELQVVARYSQYREYSKDETVFVEGSLGRELFIIKEGEVNITKHQDDSERNIARFIAGECFGELDMLQNTPRTATASAGPDTVLLVFPSDGLTLDEVLSHHADISAQILHKLLTIIAGRIRSTNRLISEKSPWIQDLRRQLLNDKLTGLYNRTFLEEDFKSVVAENPVISLAFIKPDNFKIVNDTYGHEAGDRVLRLMADTLRAAIRENDVAVRYRGDEFAVVLPDTPAEVAVSLSGGMKAALSALDISTFINGDSLNITFSIGVAAVPHHAGDSASLVKKSFDTMMEARTTGGDLILSA